MSALGQTERVQPPRRFRFGLGSILRLQLLLAPVFMAPVYAQHRGDPYLHFLAFLAAPIGYVLLLHFTSPIRALRWKSPVYSAAWQGMLYGILFGALAMVPVGLWQLSTPMQRELSYIARFYNPSVLATLAVLWRMFLLLLWPVLISLFVLLHYALIGAATGGVCAIAGDLRRRRAGRLAPSNEVLSTYY